MSLEVEISMHVGNQIWILSLRSLEFRRGKRTGTLKQSFVIREVRRKL